MGLTKEDLARALADAGITAVRRVNVCDGHVRLEIEAEPGADGAAIKSRAAAAIEKAFGSGSETLSQLMIDLVPPGKQVQQDPDIPMKQGASSKTTGEGTVRPGSPSLPGVRHVIAVGAGKGGVGKSTVSVNLAVGLARAGHAVGLLDGDIYGPSVPTLLGLDGMDVALLENMLEVFYVHGVKAMTIGKLVDPEKPLIWRGPMAHGAFKQLVEQTSWGELDYLVIDLPPGTGDVPLSMSQMLSLTGAVIVCTPQKVAQDDAVRAARMFQQLGVEVLGVVENMSYFIGDDGKEYDIFGRGGAEQMAQRLGLPFLGSVPINMDLRRNSDAGDPTRNFTDSGEGMKRSLEGLVKRIEDEVAMATLRKDKRAPTMTVS